MNYLVNFNAFRMKINMYSSAISVENGQAYFWSLAYMYVITNGVLIIFTLNAGVNSRTVLLSIDGSHPAAGM
jgi:hypothetical protein